MLISQILVYTQNAWRVKPLVLGEITAVGDLDINVWGNQRFDDAGFAFTPCTDLLQYHPVNWSPGDYATPPTPPSYFTFEFFNGNPDFYGAILYDYDTQWRVRIMDENYYPQSDVPVRRTAYSTLPFKSGPLIPDPPSNYIYILVYPAGAEQITDIQYACWATRYRKATGYDWSVTSLGASWSDMQDQLDVMGINWADPDEDPYEPGSISDAGGGGGTFTIGGTRPGLPGLPTLSVVDMGFISIYRPSLTEVRNLANYLWSAAFDLNSFKQIFAQPMDFMLGASIVPVDPGSGGTKEITVGAISTGVYLTVANTQYVSVDCGSITIPRFFDSALDYSPYTKYSLFLPYIGTQMLKTDEIIGKTIKVVYHVDILSGALTAFVCLDGVPYYQYGGNCAIHVPITAGSWARAITSTIQLAASIGGAIASGGATAANLVGTTANAVQAMKPEVQHAGAVSGGSGQLGNQKPYLIAEIPRQSLAEGYQKFCGFPSNITRQLGVLSGYTEVDEIHLEGIPCTSDELVEIERLLKGGVIL